MANSNPRILIAASIYPPDAGGPAIHARTQYEWFKQQGIEVRLVALAHYRQWPMGIRHLLFFLSLFSKALRSDVIYAHDALGVGFPALIVSRFTNCKFVLRVGGDLAWEREAERGKTNLSMLEWYRSGAYKKNTFFFLTKIVLSRADALVVPTQLLVDVYRMHYGVSPNTIHLVSNPVPQKDEERSYPMQRKIIYASRLVSYKNLDFVVESLSHIFKKYNDFIFEIMGDGPERRNLENIIELNNLKNKILLLGKLSQAEVLKETEVCMLGLAPALTEFSPNYILQCISFGKPFLISRENGLSFAVPEEFLFNARSHAEFESKLEYILSEEGYKRCVELVQSMRFSMSWDDVLKKNLEIILSLQL